MRIEHTVHAELKLKYEKALAFIKELADESVYERYENLNELNWEANDLLKELRESE